VYEGLLNTAAQPNSNNRKRTTKKRRNASRKRRLTKRLKTKLGARGKDTAGRNKDSMRCSKLGKMNDFGERVIDEERTKSQVGLVPTLYHRMLMTQVPQTGEFLTIHFGYVRALKIERSHWSGLILWSEQNLNETTTVFSYLERFYVWRSFNSPLRAFPFSP
jgi:hypothetical protein